MDLKKNAPEIKGKNNFPLLYTCLSIIILTFFVFLTSHSVITPEKKKIAISSLSGSFGSLKRNMYPIYNKKEIPIGVGVINLAESKKVYNKLNELIKKSKLEKFVYIKKVKGNILIKTTGMVAFKKGSDKFNKSYLVLLNRIYNYISNAYNLKIKIIAYPDNFLTSEFISKSDLAQHRAIAAAKFFIKRGISADKILAYGIPEVSKNNTKLEIYISGQKYLKKKIKKKIEFKGIELKVD